MGLKSFMARPLSYRIGAAVALCFSTLLVLGVACPFWYQSGDGATYGGLWSRCDAGTGACVSLVADVTQDWWLSLQVLEPLALLCVTISCSCIIFENCFQHVDAPLLLGELLGLLGGALGLVGCLVFLGKTEPSSEPIYATYSWSFYFTIIGSIVVFVASVVILLGGKAAAKSLRMPHHQANVSPEPVRRFSQLWARESASTPEVVRKQMIGSAMSRYSTSCPPGSATPPTTAGRSDTQLRVTLEQEEVEPSFEAAHF